MKLVVLLAVVVFVAARPDATIPEINIEELVSNDKLMKAYLSCFNGDGKCTPEANSIKKLIPSAVETSCGDCHTDDKKKIGVFLNAARNKHADILNKIIAQYDPEGKRQAELDAFIKENS